MNEPDIKRLPIKEFREFGYLHEVNRLLLHPLGLALEVNVATEPTRVVTMSERTARFLEDVCALADQHEACTISAEDASIILDALRRGVRVEAGDGTLGGVWDCRDEAEGVTYGDDLLSAEKAKNVADAMFERRTDRIKALGYVIQPVPDERVLTTNYADPGSDAPPPRRESFEGIGEVEFEQ